MEGTGIGAKWAIKQAMAEALRKAADDLGSRDLTDGERQYNASIEWPKLYTVKPEEGPAALRAVAREITRPTDEPASDGEREALALLGRIYRREAPRQLHDAGMAEEWIHTEIATFIRRFGAL